MTEKPLHERKLSEVLVEFDTYCNETRDDWSFFDGRELLNNWWDTKDKLKRWAIAIVKNCNDNFLKFSSYGAGNKVTKYVCSNNYRCPACQRLMNHFEFTEKVLEDK